MDTLRTKHPALAFLVSLSVAGTCLAVPGLALADAATSDNGSPSDNAAEVVEAAKPLDAATATDAAADAADTTDAAATDAAAGKDAKPGRDTKDIKVNGATVTFAGISVDVPTSFKVMNIHHVMAVAVSPSGEMSVTVAAPDMRALAANGGTADLGYFDRVVAALAEGADMAIPGAEEVKLADDVTAYKYVFQLTDTDDGVTELDDQVTLVFVPVDDAYAVVQITVDEDVVSVADETVDSIISSIRIAPATAADATTDSASADATTKAADTETNTVLSDAEKAAADADKAAADKVADDSKDAADKAGEVAKDAAEDAKDAADKVADDVKDAAEDAGKDVEKAAEDTKDAVVDVADDAKDAADKVVDDVKDAGKDDAKDAEQTTDAAEDTKDATDAVVVSPAADASGTTVSVAGMTFVLPEDLTAEAYDSDSDPVWSNAADGFTVAVKSAVSDDVTKLTMRDLDRTALKMAASMNGEVIGTALFDNDGATVYMYAIVFHEADQAYVGTVGFVAANDGSLNALTTRFPLDQMATFAPIVEGMYETVTVD